MGLEPTNLWCIGRSQAILLVQMQDPGLSVNPAPSLNHRSRSVILVSYPYVSHHLFSVSLEGNPRGLITFLATFLLPPLEYAARRVVWSSGVCRQSKSILEVVNSRKGGCCLLDRALK